MLFANTYAMSCKGKNISRFSFCYSMYFKLLEIILKRTKWAWELNKQGQFVRVLAPWGGFYININLTGKLNSLKIIFNHWFSHRYPKLNLFLYTIWYHKIYKFISGKTYRLNQQIIILSQLYLINIRIKTNLQEIINLYREERKNYAKNKSQ